MEQIKTSSNDLNSIKSSSVKVSNTQKANCEKCMVKISGLKKRFSSKDGTVTALDGIDLEVNRGDIYGIIGMSGAGKSTLIRCINRLDTPSEGNIVIDGTDISTMTGSELRNVQHSVGMVFQHFNLLMQRNVLRNVTFPMELIKVPKTDAIKRAKELINLVGLSDKANAYPSQLSGGQKQRVAIARALASNPKVLLCDEATSALDPMTTRSILSLLEDINHRLGITIIIITHQMEVIRQICTHVAVIDGGRIAESGTVEEVFARPKTESSRRLFRHHSHDLAPASGRYIHITFEGETAHEPIISRMVLECGVPINIISGDICRVGNKAFGQLIIEFPEDESASKRALDYLDSCGLVWEEVKTNGDDLVEHDGTGTL